MLGENIIAFDTLETEKHNVKDLTDAIIETENQNLKQTLIQMRNQAEQAQYEIYKIAEQNNDYLAAGQADSQQVSKFKNFFNQNFQNQPSQMQTGGQQFQNRTQQQATQPSYQRNQGVNNNQNRRQQVRYQTSGISQNQQQQQQQQQNSQGENKEKK